MTEKIAVVGVACRFPGGVADLEGLWSLLLDGREAVGEPPSDRFDLERYHDRNQLRPGKSYTFAGGYLDDISGFDAEFFGISPREAASIDPQQRLLLELGFEALDDAAIDPLSLRGSDGAVFVGASVMDYGGQQMLRPDGVGPYTNSGSALSNTANRLSYQLDLHGPSVKVDTACASALSAVHLACDHLASGQGRLAFAAGVNVLLNPMAFVGFAKAGFLSPSGHCRPFSEAADGYVRAEGGGVLVLKRLADALADGDRVHAVIEGWGSNSDGHTAGLVLPSAHAQEALLHQVYERFSLDPDELLYLEAHGTGTPVGDPVECTAIGNALGVRRAKGPLPIGSVKGNLGHLEPASGMAGLCKALLVLQHRHLPPAPHTGPRSEGIDFEALALSPVERPAPTGEGSLVGVSSFGFGGTNAHVVLGAPPAESPAARQQEPAAVPVVVSGHTEAALADALSLMDARLSTCTDFTDLAYSSWRRGRHAHRRVVLAQDAEEARRRLAEPDVARRGTARGKVAFAFAGHGSTWPGMAADLLDTDPVFTRTVAEVDAVLEPLVGWRVAEELRAAEPRLADTQVVQPVLFAVQVGIVAVLQEQGLRPEAVYGHSVGEIAAAFTAGVYDLAQAVELVVARSRAQSRTAGTGTMAAAALPPEEAESLLGGYGGRVEIACVNSATDVTLAGPRRDLDDLAARLGERGVFCRVLDLDYPFHSAAMDPLHPEVMDALAGLAPKPAHVEFVSTVRGGPVPGERMDAQYWWRNIREPVRFAAATDHLVAAGFDTIIEIGPHPVLATYLRRAQAPDRILAVLPTLTKTASGPDALRAAVEAALAVGVPVDEDRYFPGAGRVVPLPRYPWQRERFFSGDKYTWAGVCAAPDHILLGDRAEVADPTWQSTVDPARIPWLGEHRVGGSAVMPAAAFLEMGWAAGALCLEGPVEVSELRIVKALAAPEDESALPRSQVSLSAEDGVLRVATRTGANHPWQTHTRGRVRRRLTAAPPPLDVESLRSRLAEHGRSVDHATHYADLERLGLTYGPVFRGISRVWVEGREVLAEYDCAHLDPTGFHAHPAWTDMAPQCAVHLGRMLRGSVSTADAYLPIGVGTARLWADPTPTGLVHFRALEISPSTAAADITMTDERGNVLLELLDFRFMRVPAPDSSKIRRQHTVLRAAPRALAPAAEATCRLPQDMEAPADDYDLLRERRLALVAGFVTSAARELLGGADVFFTDDLFAAGVRAEHARLLDHLLSIASEHGFLDWLGEFQGRTRWRITAKHGPSYGDTLAEFPGFVTDLTLVGRCGHHLADLLRGERDVLDILFPAHGSDTLSHYYDLLPTLSRLNRAAAGYLRALAEAWPADRPLRILEVGGGTGGLTAALLPVLPPDRTRYLFTDVSPYFLGPAAARFAAYDFVEYQAFDLDQPGFDPGTFDVVVAGNALHAAKDVQAALGSLSRLLTDHGHLLFIESHDPQMLALPFGLVPGFWSMTDLDLRPRSPLLSTREWRALLPAHDLTEGNTLLESGPCSLTAARRLPRTAALRDTLPTGPGHHVVILCEDASRDERAEALAARLAEQGATVDRENLQGDPGTWLRGPSTDVVLLLSPADDSPDGAVRATTRRFELVRAMAVASGSLAADGTATLWLVGDPPGVHPAPDPTTAPVDAALWGATRTLAAECATLTVRRISMDPEAPLDGLIREILDPTDEDEVVLTARGRFVPRLRELTPPPAPDDAGPYRLVMRDPGPSCRLAWVATDPLEPGPGQVAVQVGATGLNYRDALLTAGMLPDWMLREGIAGAHLGYESSGVVSAVGADVTRFRPGDRVVGFGTGGFASHVLVAQELVRPLPSGFTMESASGAPVAFVTVDYGLRHLARLAEGETVLVHGAAGAVGLAAIQVARSLGARVIATAGTEEKRDVLRLLGIEHVFDSRTLSFVPGVLDATGGQGVDVVLNSLGGEFISRSLDLLRQGGRFVELGKRDLYEDKNVSLRLFRNSISYFAVDIDQLGRHRVEELGAACDTFLAKAQEDTYRPIPYRVFPAAQTAEALHSIQHSRHLGKIIVSFDQRPHVQAAPAAPIALDPDGSYVVSGGVSGLGAETARWLADRGARHLVLLSRRGMAVPGAENLVSELNARGAQVSVHAVDVTDEAAVRAVVEETGRSGHPLRGIVHAAMVLDDAMAADLTPERFEAVLAPKMAGALVLDRVAEGHALDLFLMFSSAAAVFGNAGQAAYCAGNLFLEALARARRSRGLPAQTIAWGALAEVGYLARNDTAARLVARAGLNLMPLHEVRSALDELAGGPEVALVWSHDGEIVRRLYSHLTTPRLADLTGGGYQDDEEHDDLIERLRKASPEEAIALVTDTIVRTLAGVLGIEPERVDRTRPLDELGVDSLMGVELVTKMRRRFGREIPLMRVISSSDIDHLARSLVTYFMTEDSQ
ncbi:SDR family NAD(P)-dependent oxidoreductase [Streptomyces sp. NPDC004126]|uniref:SDR family NAD(P)-dependent oxidoreductase n=1 Tax=Streptomyces sp. NPDC004126 TaxID=3390695 RepID=UPI003D0242D0